MVDAGYYFRRVHYLAAKRASSLKIFAGRGIVSRQAGQFHSFILANFSTNHFDTSFVSIKSLRTPTETVAKRKSILTTSNGAKQC